MSTTKLNVRGARVVKEAVTASSRPNIATLILAEAESGDPTITMSFRLHLEEGDYLVGSYQNVKREKRMYHALPGDLDFTKGSTVQINFHEVQEDGSTNVIDFTDLTHEDQFSFAGFEAGTRNATFFSTGQNPVRCKVPRFLPGQAKANYFQAMVALTDWELPSEEVIREFLAPAASTEPASTEPVGANADLGQLDF